MIGKAVVVVQVAFQRLPRFSLCVSSIDTCLLLETVAVVPAVTVLGPWSHTNPTKLILALSAGHVVAATILFNGRSTFTAFLGIGGNPIGGL